MAEEPDIATLASAVVYENRWMRVREDRVRRRDGATGIYGYVEKPDFVVVAPLHEGRLHLVEQYRYPIRQRQWELPQGSVTGAPDMPPEEVARQELAEETGLVAGRVVEVGRLYPLDGTASQAYRAYLATGLTQGAQALEPEEQDLVVRAFPVADVEAMILDGTIRDAATVATFGLLRLRGLI